jgi:hypothetical protein
MEETNSELLQSEFEATAAPAPPRVRVTLDLTGRPLEKADALSGQICTILTILRLMALWGCG